MTDRPPTVDFSTPYSPLAALVAQRNYLRSVAEDIRGAMQVVDRYQAEALHDANMAAVWAATLMVCDVIKIGLSAGDRRAKILFAAMDRAMDRANRVLTLLGAPKVATKSDILAAVDADLRGSVKMIDTVRQTRNALASLKVPTSGGSVDVKLPKEANLVIDLGIAMAEDSILILQAQGMVNQAGAHAAFARGQMRTNLNRVLQRVLLVDSEITREFERLQRQSNIA